MIIHAVLFGHDEQILGMIIVSIVVVRADVYDLLELPSVRHGRQHLSDFGLFELNHPIDPFNVLENVYYMRIVEMWGKEFGEVLYLRVSSVVTITNALFDEVNELVEVVEFGLLEHALFLKVVLDDELAVPQVVQDGREVLRVSVD